VSRILDHKDWLGVRHYQVEWVNFSQVTWVPEEQLEGVDSADEAIQRYLDAEVGTDNEESVGSGGDVVAHIVCHKDWQGVRYYQVEWVSASQITWVPEEELEGIDGADDGIRRYFRADNKADGKREEAKRKFHSPTEEDGKRGSDGPDISSAALEDSGWHLDSMSL